MVRGSRSATLQMRVTPEVKLASERVLRRIGLSMSEAIELFLRRMIVDQRIPFDIVAFDNATWERLKEELLIAKRHDRGSKRAGSKR
jgi:DNA-damage-inducible protein J